MRSKVAVLVMSLAAGAFVQGRAEAHPVLLGKPEAKKAKEAPPPTVEITQVEPATADIYTEYPAQTYARNMVDVRGRVAGYI